MKRILALIVCLLSAQMMMAQTTELQAKRVRALDSVFINGRWVKSVGIDTALSGTNRDIVSIEAVRLHVANRMAGVASLYTTKNQFLDSINALKLLIGDGGSLDWTSGYPTYDLRYAQIARLTDTAAAIWGRVQSTYQVAQANYSTTFALLNDGRDSIQNRYTKAQSDARYLQSFTETDPTVYAWAKAATKPAYAVAEISGLQTALDGKQNVLGFTPVPDTRTINGAPLSANIVISKGDIGLGSVPNVDATNPANISQSSSFRFVTDTEKSTWNAKQNALGYTPENIANKGQANGYAALGSDSKILAYQLPQVAINQTFTVNSQSAMLALSANQGDIAVRTDQNKAYILAFTGASTLANWIALPGVSNEADPVFTASVAYGITGTNVSNWNTAFGWGNHAGLYRPVSWVPSWTDVTGRPTALSQFTNDLGNYGGWITGINSTMVTTALGYTPANSSSLSSYLPLSGGTLTGAVLGTSAEFSTGIGTEGMGRFKGWYSSGTGAAAEVGTFGGSAYLFAYDRTASAYIPAQIRGSEIKLNIGGTDALTVTATGTVNIQSTNQALRVNGGSYGNSGGNYHTHGYNVGFTSTGDVWTYLASDFASFIRYQSGGFQFYTAPSGTAGATMSPTLRYTLDVNGNNTWTGNGTFGGSATATQFNGSGAGLTGTASSLTAGNSNLWSSQPYSGDWSSGSILGFMVYQSSVAPAGWKYMTTANVQSALGLGSYAYRSSGLAELSGATFTGGIVINNSNATNELFFNGNDFTNIYSNTTGGMHVGISNAASTGSLSLVTANVERLTISSSGAAAFSSSIAATSASFSGVGYAGSGFYTGTGNEVGFNKDGSNRMAFRVGGIDGRVTIDNSGNIIGGSYSGTSATFSSSVTATQFNGSGAGLTSVPWGSITGAPSFLTTAVTSATGTTNQITVSASTGAVTFSLPSAVTISGNMTAAGFFESSDIRLKEVFEEYKSADGINPILYTFKNEFRPKYGYSAQQVERELSFAVQKGDDGYLKVDYTTVHTYKIMQLEKRIAELEKQLKK